MIGRIAVLMLGFLTICVKFATIALIFMIKNKPRHVKTVQSPQNQFF